MKNPGAVWFRGSLVMNPFETNHVTCYSISFTSSEYMETKLLKVLALQAPNGNVVRHLAISK
jgi:hypothetical protein